MSKEREAHMARGHRQDIIASLKGIFAVVAVLVGFIVFLALLVILESLVIG